jgi:hypothetical protein
MSEKEPFRAIYYGKSAKKPPTEAYTILGLGSDRITHYRE